MESAYRLSAWLGAAFVAWTVANLVRQTFHKPESEPPVVFHWLPFIGNTIEYGQDPLAFFTRCRAKYGDIFTFVLLGKKITCYVGIDGNEFILNGKQQDLNAEEVYSPLTTPVFGSDVVYDCPNSKLIEQKKFVKFGLTEKAFHQYTPQIEAEVLDYVDSAPAFHGDSGRVDITRAMSEITILTAARTLQGDEVRSKLSAEFATLYHDLDMGFQPINFLLPWAPLPHNRKRDAAHASMRQIYIDIVKKRRAEGTETLDMISNLMGCEYKNGAPVPDKEIAHMMITLLMAGQHTSSASSAWIILHLASSPEVAEELYQEQVAKLSQKDGRLPPLQYQDLVQLPLLRSVIKETLRCHSSISSVMRKVKRPIPVPGTPYVVGTDKTLLAAPIVTALDEEHFPEAREWKPHRWIEAEKKGGDADADDDIDFADAASFSRGVRNPYLPFGAGRHRCIGEKFAYLNLSAIASTLVREFRFTTLDGNRGVPRTDYASLFSRPVEPAVIRWERRAKNEEMGGDLSV